MYDFLNDTIFGNVFFFLSNDDVESIRELFSTKILTFILIIVTQKWKRSHLKHDRHDKGIRVTCNMVQNREKSLNFNESMLLNGMWKSKTMRKMLYWHVKKCVCRALLKSEMVRLSSQLFLHEMTLLTSVMFEAKSEGLYIISVLHI